MLEVDYVTDRAVLELVLLAKLLYSEGVPGLIAREVWIVGYTVTTRAPRGSDNAGTRCVINVATKWCFTTNKVCPLPPCHVQVWCHWIVHLRVCVRHGFDRETLRVQRLVDESQVVCHATANRSRSKNYTMRINAKLISTANNVVKCLDYIIK